MNNSRPLPTTQTGKSTDPNLSVAGHKLTVSRSVLQFDRTDPGDESYLTLRVTPPYGNVLVALAVSDPALFQVAVGVSRLAFKQSLTFKPEEGGSYIHVRYTPERSGRHRSTLTIEIPAFSETITVQLAGHTGGIAAITRPERTRSLPAPLNPNNPSAGTSARPGGALAKALLAVGLGVAGYVFRCDIWPASCTQSAAVTEPVRSEPTGEPLPEAVAPAPAITREPAPEPRRAIPERVTTVRPKATKPIVAEKARVTVAAPSATPPVRTPTKQTALAETPREQPVTRQVERTQPVPAAGEAPKPAAVAAKPAAKPRTQSTATTPAQKPATKPQNNEESELEQVLNKGNN